MRNNKLVTSKKGLFNKILNKIKLSFFNRQKEESKEEKHEISKSNFNKEIRANVGIDNSYQKKQFMNKIRDNPSLLENFSLERLIQIRDYWEDRVEKEKQILLNMKKNS